MILFALLFLIAFILIVIVSIAVVIGGVLGIVLFGDAIVCIFIICFIMHKLLDRH